MKSTFVITLSGPAAGSGVVELDPDYEGNLDGESVKSSFLPGEEAVFIVNVPTGIAVSEIVVRRDCGGVYLEPGFVLREKTEEVTFTPESPSASLACFPSSRPIVSLYTVPSSVLDFRWAGQSISASGDLPVVGVARYTAAFRRFVYTPPAALALAAGEAFVVAIQIVTISQ